jgi:AAA+ superfamily predicted ATPase
LAPNPNYKEDFFEVEKVLGKKKIKDKTFYLVKYLYYPSKFNQYIPEENFKT